MTDHLNCKFQAFKLELFQHMYRKLEEQESFKPWSIYSDSFVIIKLWPGHEMQKLKRTWSNSLVVWCTLDCMMGLCKTVVITLFYITSYNSSAPSPRHETCIPSFELLMMTHLWHKREFAIMLISWSKLWL